MVKSGAKPAQKTRIQSLNEELILDAALEVFAAAGFRAATIDEVARRCGLSKPNLLYYFKRKEDLYRAVLERTLSTWLVPLKRLDPDGDPITELSGYIAAKIEMSFANPVASRLFANEVLHGAPVISGFLKDQLKELVDHKASVIRQWADAGKIARVDPHHLIFSIWAVTQHYADFAEQVSSLLGKAPDQVETCEQVTRILLGGLKRS